MSTITTKQKRRWEGGGERGTGEGEEEEEGGPQAEVRELGSNLGFLTPELSVNELKREKKGKRVKVGRMGGRRAWSSASHAS